MLEKILKLFPRLILVVLCLLHSSVSGAPASSVFWRVSNGHKTFYILGVTHIGDARQYPIAASVVDALMKSSIYITETRTAFDSPDQVKKIIRTEYAAKSGKTLRSLLGAPECLSVEGANKIAPLLHTVLPEDISAHLLDLSPRATIHQIANPEIAVSHVFKTQLKSAPAIEAALRVLAKEQKIPYGALDDEYWRGIDQLSATQTCKLLVSLLQFYAHRDRDEIAMTASLKIIDAWAENDADTNLSAYLAQYEKTSLNGDSSAIRELMKNRNMNMVRILESFDNRVGFVAIGVAHLPGPDGVIAILRRRGFLAESLEIH